MYTITDRSAKTGVVNHALSVGIDNHGFYTVMPKIGTIEKPIIINGWRFVPSHMDDSPIPAEATRQVMALKKSGVLIRQEIIGHNLKEENEKQQKIERHKQNVKKTLEQVRGLVTVLGVLAVGVFRAVSTLFLGIVGFLLAADPVYIVVLSDGTWLCVAEWDS